LFYFFRSRSRPFASVAETFRGRPTAHGLPSTCPPPRAAEHAMVPEATASVPFSPFSSDRTRVSRYAVDVKSPRTTTRALDSRRGCSAGKSPLLRHPNALVLTITTVTNVAICRSKIVFETPNWGAALFPCHHRRKTVTAMSVPFSVVFVRLTTTCAFSLHSIRPTLRSDPYS